MLTATTPARTWLAGFAVIGLFALVYRVQWIGNPCPYEDEQFYLLVANRMWHGDLPYVDIWDRKPLGLFLLYAAFVPFSQYGLVACHVAALVATVATAFVIMCIAARFTSVPAAVGGSILYIINLQVFGGQGGQSPVFYNLPMALAALLIVRIAERGDGRAIAWPAVLAMGLVGVAIQIKYTAFVEGVYFGLTLSWLRWRGSRSVARTAGLMVALAAAALMPTALSLGYYAFHGYTQAFVQANFLSIFQVVDPKNGAGIDNLVKDLTAASPFIAVASVGALLLLIERPATPAPRFVLGWVLFAALGFASIGRFYPHYLLPVLVPLAILAAPALAHVVALGSVLGTFIAITSVSDVAYAHATIEKNERYIDALTIAMKPYTRYGCLYLRDGPTIVYLTTSSCLPTRYVFPDHLSKVMESRATNAERAMTLLIASRPAAVSVSTRSTTNPDNPVTSAMLAAMLKTDYRLTADVAEAKGDGHQLVYVRRDLR